MQEEDAKRANKYGYTKHKPAKPLFDQDNAELALEYFKPVEFCAADEDYSTDILLAT